MERIIHELNHTVSALPKKRRVAAYARVSSGKDAMLHSLSAQVSYYSAYIQRHPSWEYVGAYADEALTGTKDNRPELHRLLADCRLGKVDMVITKSISRLARNTITMLKVVRELKSLNVDIWFKKENIHSMSGDGELMLTILASYAQEESHSVSENCKWRIRNNFRIGQACTIRILGYRLTDGTLTMIHEEAEIVRKIYDNYLSGMGRTAIAKKLNESGFKNKLGLPWRANAVDSILRNEKYTGDMLLQKTYTTNHIDKKTRVNKGQVPKYYVRDSHEPIISRDTFERVQAELRRRAEKHHPDRAVQHSYPFTGKIVCAQCGKLYRRKVAHDKASWNCTTFHMHGKSVCHTKQIPEGTLYSLSAEVLGLDEFDEAVFAHRIKEIRVPEFNKMVFVFADGGIVERGWKDRSRSSSWTDEAKQRAREIQLKHIARRSNL